MAASTITSAIPGIVRTTSVTPINRVSSLPPLYPASVPMSVPSPTDTSAPDRIMTAIGGAEWIICANRSFPSPPVPSGYSQVWNGCWKMGPSMVRGRSTMTTPTVEINANPMMMDPPMTVRTSLAATARGAYRYASRTRRAVSVLVAVAAPDRRVNRSESIGEPPSVSTSGSRSASGSSSVGFTVSTPFDARIDDTVRQVRDENAQ